ncbi:MAG: hypothetical protein ACQERS_11225 [Bacteroidota bacterium]
MAGLKVYLKGSTLIETIVSMIILLIISLCFYYSINHISGSFRNNFKTYSYFIYKKHIENCSIDLSEKQTKILYRSFYVICSLSPCDNNDDLFLYQVELIDNNNQTVFDGQRYILKSELNHE